MQAQKLLNSSVLSFLCVFHFLDGVGGREPVDEIEDDNLAAGALHKFMPDNGFDGVIAAFDEDIWFDGFDEFDGGFFVEEDDRIHTSEGIEHMGAMALIVDGSPVAFEGVDGVVIVDTQDQHIAELGASLEQ